MTRWAISDSPFNFTFKLRCQELLFGLGCFSSIVEMMEDLDLKSVQYETLGFIGGRVGMEAGLYDFIGEYSQTAISYYNDNSKECKDVRFSFYSGNL